MNEEQIRKLLEEVSQGEKSIEDAVGRLRDMPFEDLGHARVDHHRELRCGFPEVIFCQGKEPADLTEIAASILARSPRLLATRADEASFEAIKAASDLAEYHERARCVTVRKEPPPGLDGKILLISAGTIDIPVAEEARVTAEIMGHTVETVYDAGVAGIHRLLAETKKIQEADCIIAVAGMEGALPSVVGGLSDVPVIAVPTSGGYGASLGGITPLLTMLSSCAAGVAVVNIDNGFGAGFMSALICRKHHRDEER